MTKTVPTNLIAAILFTIQIIFRIADINTAFPWWDLLNIAGFAIVTVCLFTKKRNWLPVLGFGIILSTALIPMIITAPVYIGMIISGSSASLAAINMLGQVPSLICNISVFVWVLVSVTNRFQKCKEKIKRFWFVPGVLFLIVDVLMIGASVIYTFANNLGGSMIPVNPFHIIMNVVSLICSVVSVFMLCKWYTHPEAEE